MHSLEFYIPDDGIKLHAKLDYPQIERDKYPLMILVHGLTGHMEEIHIIGLRDTFLSCGFAVLRVEMYGHGQSEGSLENHTLYKWIANIMTVTDYAKRLDFVKDLYLCGHSQGGLLTVIAAGMRPDDYKAIFPMSPALMIPEDARKGTLLGNEFDPTHVPDYLVSDRWKLNGNYLRVAQCIYPEMYLERYKGPAFFVHGGADDTVPVAISKDAVKKLSNGKLTVIEGDSHCYDYHLDKVLAVVKNDCESLEKFSEEEDEFTDHLLKENIKKGNIKE